MDQNWGITKSIKKKTKNKSSQIKSTRQTRDPNNEIALTSQKASRKKYET